MRKENLRDTAAPESGDDLDIGTDRFCVITRARRPKERLLRMVLDPAGRWTVDVIGRLPGRGLYVIPNPVHVRTFLKKRHMTPAEIEATLLSLGEALSGRFLDGIGLARRAGCLRRGLRDVSDAIQGGQRPLLLLAADTAVHTRKKMEQLMHRYALEEIWELLDRERLGLACGNNGPVAVLAVTNSGMGRRVRGDALRWRDFLSV